MAKFIMKNGSFWISKSPAPTAVAITAATKASPCVLTITNTAAAGDAIFITGTGWNSLDNRMFQIVTATATSITIAVDTTGETAALGTAALGAIYESTDWIEACLQGVDLDSGTADTIAVGTFCDAGASLAGAIPNGTLNITGFVDPTDAGYNALLAASSDGLPRTFRLDLPKAANPASTGNTGGSFYFPNATVGAVSQSYQTGAAATFTSALVLGAKASFAPAPTT
jgi:hypothetical protein